MRRALALALVPLALAVAPRLALASGMDPGCRFGAPPAGAARGAGYRIADAYRAATLVVVGRVTAAAGDMRKDGMTLTLHVARVVKGKDARAGDDIRLVGPRCAGTACSGLSIAKDVDFLLLLRREPDGRFHKIDGSGNDACPNVFEVKGDAATIGGKPLPIGKLDKLLPKSPAIAYQ